MKLSEGHRRGQKRRQRAKAVKAAKALKAKRDAEKRLKALGERSRASRERDAEIWWGLEIDLF